MLCAGGEHPVIHKWGEGATFKGYVYLTIDAGSYVVASPEMSTRKQCLTWIIKYVAEDLHKRIKSDNG
jgi:hypothetical protein